VLSRCDDLCGVCVCGGGGGTVRFEPNSVMERMSFVGPVIHDSVGRTVENGKHS
jgi:hypothetical protein